MGRVAHGVSCPWGEMNMGRNVMGRVSMGRVVHWASFDGACPGIYCYDIINLVLVDCRYTYTYICIMTITQRRRFCHTVRWMSRVTYYIRKAKSINFRESLPSNSLRVLTFQKILEL
jgi:hypothetical protein